MFRPALLLLIAIPAIGHAQVGGGNDGIFRAAAEINMAILFFKVLMGAFGLYAVGWSVWGWVKFNEGAGSRGADGKSGMLYGVGALIGILMLSWAFTVGIMSNTAFGTQSPSGSMDVVYSLSRDPTALRNFVNSSVYLDAVEERGRFPTGVLKVLFMMMVLGGVIATWRGFRIWWIAITSGSEMGGTSVGHKTGAIFWHLFGGMALINIEKTLTLLSTTGAALLSAAF